jgi:polyphosphate glucokinase
MATIERKPRTLTKPRSPGPRRIMAIDVGGTKLKILLMGEAHPRKGRSGPDLTPALLIEKVRKLAKGWRYDAVSIGIPSVVGATGPITEPGNLGPGWVGFDYAAGFGCPVRIANDATMQALGSYDGGRMLFIGLGTGVGSALIVEHVVVPLELGELRVGNRSISDMLGRAAFEATGKKEWRKAVFEAIPSLQKAFLADYLVFGGGNSKYLGKTLPPGVRIGNNLTAFRGGFRLWGIDDLPRDGVPHGRKRLASIQGEWRLL